MVATRGDRGQAWDSFDTRKCAKAANDIVEESAGEDMLDRVGIAAE